MLNNYEYFIQQEQEKAKHYFDRLHDLIDRKNHLFKAISKYKDYLVFVNFPFRLIERIQYQDIPYLYSISDDFFEDTLEHQRLKINITSYLNLNTHTIPNTIERLKFHSMQACMPKKIYRQIMMAINNEISKYLLTGGKYQFKNRIGALKISRFERDFSKEVVDWGETNKEGKRVLHLDDEYLAVKYYKKNSTADNYKLYKFKFTSFINTPERKQTVFYDSVKTIDEILLEDRVGNLEKMMAIKQLKGINYYTKEDGI